MEAMSASSDPISSASFALAVARPVSSLTPVLLCAAAKAEDLVLFVDRFEVVAGELVALISANSSVSVSVVEVNSGWPVRPALREPRARRPRSVEDDDGDCSRACRGLGGNALS